MIRAYLEGGYMKSSFSTSRPVRSHLAHLAVSLLNQCVAAFAGDV